MMSWSTNQNEHSRDHKWGHCTCRDTCLLWLFSSAGENPPFPGFENHRKLVSQTIRQKLGQQRHAIAEGTEDKWTVIRDAWQDMDESVMTGDDHLSTRSNYTPDIVVYQVRICWHISNKTGTKYVHARKLGALSHDLLNCIQEIVFWSHRPITNFVIHLILIMYLSCLSTPFWPCSARGLTARMAPNGHQR